MSFFSFEDIGLRPSLVRAARRKARAVDKTDEEYVQFLIERDVLASKTFDAMLKPVRKGFKKSRLSERDLDRLVNKARTEFHSRSQLT